MAASSTFKGRPAKAGAANSNKTAPTSKAIGFSCAHRSCCRLIIVSSCGSARVTVYGECSVVACHADDQIIHRRVVAFPHMCELRCHSFQMKFQHWRGVTAVFSLEAAPVLDLHRCSRLSRSNTVASVYHRSGSRFATTGSPSRWSIARSRRHKNFIHLASPVGNQRPRFHFTFRRLCHRIFTGA